MGQKSRERLGVRVAGQRNGERSAKPARSKGSDISEELRQAVKDLGGDEEDLALIEGLDEDEEEDAQPTINKGKDSDERSLRKALGALMKELDFESVPPRKSSIGESEEVEDSEVSDDEDTESRVEERASAEDQEDEEIGKKVAEVKPREAPRKEVGTSRGTNQGTSNGKMASEAVDRQPTSGAVVPAATSWWTLLPSLILPEKALTKMAVSKLQSLRSRSQMLLDTLPPLPRSSSSSDAAFISQILQSGTHQDKLSALVLLIRESPIHAVKELSRLRNMAGWKEDGSGGGGNKDQRVAVLKAVADWWVAGGGKASGKLRYFADQPLLAHPDLTDRHLLVFAFEDFMKRWFFNILQVLEVLSHDTLPFVRTQTLHLIFQLLAGNAEQEQNLLRLGVNKLGDTDRTLASKTQHLVLQLLQMHPAMKAIVAREVSALVLKPSAAALPASQGTHVHFDDKKPDSSKLSGATHARYYGLITLNQITLSARDQDLATRLVQLYFEIFREILGESAKHPDEIVMDELGKEAVEKAAGKVGKWRGRRKGAKPNGRKAANEDEEPVDSAEAKMVAAVLTGINRALPYAQMDDDLFTSYMDTLFKVTHTGTFNTSIQALTLVHQVALARQTVSDRFYRTLYHSLFDTRLITSSKQAMYLNLLFKALKNDTSISRVLAFVKRLLQMLGMHQPPFICGALYLLGELFSVTPGLKSVLNEPEDDGDEHFVDAPEGHEKHVRAESSNAGQNNKVYDGRKREPQYANADASCLWELLPFTTHFHPSVSLQATQLLQSQPISGSSDIALNTLVSFLDRFVYRNPKKTLQSKGASAMQPAAAADRNGVVVNQKGARSSHAGFVNSEAFWRKKIEDVPVDQLFFHKFFSSKLAQKSASKRKKGKDRDLDEESQDISNADEDGEEDDEEKEETDEGREESQDNENDMASDLDEDEVWKAMQASMPDPGGDVELSDNDDTVEYSDSEEDGETGVDEDDSGVLATAKDADESESTEEDGDDDEDEEASGSDAVLEEKEEDEAAANDEAVSTPSVSVKRKGQQNAPSPDDSDGEFPDVEEDEDDLVPLDEMPDIVLNGDKSADEAAEEESEQAGKRKRSDERKARRKKRREMPTFGDYEDYRALIEGAPSEED